MTEDRVSKEVPAANGRGRKRFVFVASNDGWGGSELLWSATALTLAKRGHEVVAFKCARRDADEALGELRAAGVLVRDLFRLTMVPRPVMNRLMRAVPGATRLLEALRIPARLARADLVILSQGGNYDGAFLGEPVQRRAARYAIISHKATELDWPYDDVLPRLRRVFAGAARCYFVDDHTRRLTEEQLGFSLSRSELVRNPFKGAWHAESPWPPQDTGVRVACVGRLFIRDKGQDLLLRVLAMPKWRRRPFHLSLFGSGPHEQALKGLARQLSLENVSFRGFVDSPSEIWRDHHALVLPSRCEGLPLVLVEAMLSARVPIVTNVGGNAELVRDGINGFLAAAPTECALDDVLERAWQARERWREMGECAGRDARGAVPADPAAEFADRLLELVEQS